MYNGCKVAVVLPAFKAASTLARTCADIPPGWVDELILVDDFSPDETVKEAQKLGIKHIIIHEYNKGYGGNQKTCYSKALSLDADIIVMLHPDYQYTPALLPGLISLIAHGVYPVVIGSRILGKGALNGGMPLYKYFFNRVLTFIQNILMNQKLSEYHTGYRAFHRSVLSSLPLHLNSDDFVFDNQMLAQIFNKGFQIGEISCPTRYESASSSISFRRSIVYGWGVLGVSFRYFLHQTKIIKYKILT